MLCKTWRRCLSTAELPTREATPPPPAEATIAAQQCCFERVNTAIICVSNDVCVLIGVPWAQVTLASLEHALDNLNGSNESIQHTQQVVVSLTQQQQSPVAAVTALRSRAQRPQTTGAFRLHVVYVANDLLFKAPMPATPSVDVRAALLAELHAIVAAVAAVDPNERKYSQWLLPVRSEVVVVLLLLCLFSSSVLIIQTQRAPPAD